MKVLPWPRFMSMQLQLGAKRRGLPLAALDVGKKHIGVAISDPNHSFSSPLAVIHRKEPRMSIEALNSLSKSLNDIVTEHLIGGFVVGLPVMDDGTITPFCKEIMKLCENIECIVDHTDVCATLWNERHSSVDARALIKKFSTKRSVVLKNKDTVAAALILQGYLDKANGL